MLRGGGDYTLMMAMHMLCNATLYNAICEIKILQFARFRYNLQDFNAICNTGIILGQSKAHDKGCVQAKTLVQPRHWSQWRDLDSTSYWGRQSEIYE